MGRFPTMAMGNAEFHFSTCRGVSMAGAGCQDHEVKNDDAADPMTGIDQKSPQNNEGIGVRQNKGLIRNAIRLLMAVRPHRWVAAFGV